MDSHRPVLVVDDDEDIRDIVAMVLQSAGYEVETAGDGLEAIERISQGLRPSLVLLDMMMPRLDGRGFLIALRKTPAAANTPVVLLSGHHAAQQEAAKLNTHGCLTKPIELDELVETVARFRGD